MKIRQEQDCDIEAIRQVTKAAFAGALHASGTEATIIDALREANALALSLVAILDGELVGHVALSPVTIDGRSGSWFGLGPVSVRPDLQGQEIGSTLIREGCAGFGKRAPVAASSSASRATTGDSGFVAKSRCIMTARRRNIS